MKSEGRTLETFEEKKIPFFRNEDGDLCIGYSPHDIAAEDEDGLSLYRETKKIPVLFQAEAIQIIASIVSERYGKVGPREDEKKRSSTDTGMKAVEQILLEGGEAERVFWEEFYKAFVEGIKNPIFEKFLNTFPDAEEKILETLQAPPVRQIRKLVRDIFAPEDSFVEVKEEYEEIFIYLKEYFEELKKLTSINKKVDAEAKKEDTPIAASALQSILDAEERLDDPTRPEGLIFLDLQPKVDPITGESKEAEALCRTFEPDGKTRIPPDRFIPVAEEYGLINRLGLIVAQKAVNAVVDLAKQGLQIKIAFNISPEQLKSAEHFLREMRKIMEQAKKRLYAIDPNLKPLLEAEITESALSDFDRVNKILIELRKMGYTTAIDDFGTEHSSLGRLKKMNANCIKIDKKFVEDLASSEVDQSIVRAVFDFSTKIKAATVAEGTETGEQVGLLLALRKVVEVPSSLPFLIQGWHFSKALPQKEFLRFMLDYNREEDDGNGGIIRPNVQDFLSTIENPY